MIYNWNWLNMQVLIIFKYLRGKFLKGGGIHKVYWPKYFLDCSEKTYIVKKSKFFQVVSLILNFGSNQQLMITMKEIVLG